MKLSKCEITKTAIRNARGLCNSWKLHCESTSEDWQFPLMETNGENPTKRLVLDEQNQLKELPESFAEKELLENDCFREFVIVFQTSVFVVVLPDGRLIYKRSRFKLFSYFHNVDVLCGKIQISGKKFKSGKNIVQLQFYDLKFVKITFCCNIAKTRGGG